MQPKPIDASTGKWITDRWRYNPVTGIIHWKDGPRVNHPVSKIVNVNGLERTQGKVEGRSQTFTYARVCWFLHYGIDADALIDHENRDCSDHRITNLRLASKSTNGMNRSRQKHRQHDLPKNVYHHRDGRYRASVRVDHKTISGGVHDTVEEAASAAQTLRETYHGEYAHG